MLVTTFVFLAATAVCSSGFDAFKSLWQHKRNTQCYGDLGCFSTNGNVPLPYTPSHIATQFYLHRRGHAGTSSLGLAALDVTTSIRSWSQRFDPHKQTKLIIHGYIDNGHTHWIQPMVDELLKKGDFNVIVVDWGHGSRAFYEKAVANVYVVGRQVAQLLTHLHTDLGASYSTMHLIGHSLGAQISGVAGENIPGKLLGRITGMDPADPEFTGQPTNRRLDANDAVFVDVIHTDASKYIVVSGLGTHDAVGDIDFYPNGGEHQPGCVEEPIGGALGSLLHGSLSGAADAFKCSHSRSHELFMESINSQCRFHGHHCLNDATFENGNCLGCPAGGCPIMGFDADQTAASRGIYFLSTSGSSPYCGNEYFVGVSLTKPMPQTQGEFFVTLVGSQGNSEELKLQSTIETFDHGTHDNHVIATHVNIGTLQSVKIKFVGSSSMPLHSVRVQPVESGSSVTFCAGDRSITSGNYVTLTTRTGC